MKAFDFEFILIDEATGFKSEKTKLDISICANTLKEAAIDAQHYIFKRVEEGFAVRLFYNGKEFNF